MDLHSCLTVRNNLSLDIDKAQTADQPLLYEPSKESWAPKTHMTDKYMTQKIIPYKRRVCSNGHCCLTSIHQLPTTVSIPSPPINGLERKYAYQSSFRHRSRCFGVSESLSIDGDDDLPGNRSTATSDITGSTRSTRKRYDYYTHAPQHRPTQLKQFNLINVLIIII
jgi:hypothetical protein